MKKIALAALSLFLVSGATAQEIKLILGAGSSTYSKPWAPEYWWDWTGRGSGINPLKNVRGAMVAGFGVEFPAWGALRLEVDLLYFARGALYRQENLDPEQPEADERVKKEFALQGFALPLLAKFRVLRSPRPYAIAGLDVALAMAHELYVYTQYAVSGPDYQRSQEIQLLHETRKLDVGPVLGVGYDIVAPAGTISLELRYHAGLPDMNLEPGEYRVGSRSLLLIVGFRI